VRGGGEIPLPYVLEKQKYNLTDEILRRLKVHKDFDELYDEIQKTDTNNQIVVKRRKISSVKLYFCFSNTYGNGISPPPRTSKVYLPIA